MTVQNICQIDKAEKCGRLKIEIELDKNSCSNNENCGSKIKINIRVSFRLSEFVKVKHLLSRKLLICPEWT